MKRHLVALTFALCSTLALSGCGKTCKDYCGQCGESEEVTKSCLRACDACENEGDTLAACIEDNVGNYCAAGSSLTILDECAPEMAAYTVCQGEAGLDSLLN